MARGLLLVLLFGFPSHFAQPPSKQHPNKRNSEHDKEIKNARECGNSCKYLLQKRLGKQPRKQLGSCEANRNQPDVLFARAFFANKDRYNQSYSRQEYILNHYDMQHRHL